MRKVCIFTGGRAEYGLLRPLLQELKDDENVELQLLVSGMHLSPEFGLTYKEIEKDGYVCNEKVEMVLSSDTPSSTVKSMGLGMIGFSDALERLAPDVLVTLGDRYENMAVVTAAWVCRIPVAHIQGGEKTLGAIDDQFRHCITKLSTLHFVTTEEYRKRVIQLGEEPNRVFDVGALNVDALKKIELLSKSELECQIGLKFDKPTILVTFHPVTLEKDTAEQNFSQFLAALDELGEVNVIFTKTLADTEGRVINGMIDEYVSQNKLNTVAFTSLGQLRYISALNYVDVVAGNSSSGIIETPSFKVPTINVGKREKGRIMADNVICVEQSKESIISGFKKAFSKEFKDGLNSMHNPYEKADTAIKIKDVLVGYEFAESTMKSFYDVKVEDV
ncbi:UDP-N-acetylglucosamine 2-epimerase [Vibrio fluvialis]|uniref:UDP-N-acetylglucosamine 2-epimerase n=2 Tax=Vibrio TaxID=662 RepID=UPI001C9C786B|nr:UDP-N-acetylglucosamine 2-epimerase [Vibrio fluvialis]EKO5124731.1 UDP-N-acetylglucosamine 2-epimerase (hydrolyzing) [Vibrio fluvialis]MBY7911381.1 UDP-N-acetylglucosamine 2-epimerase (hydrolyzing) [Vibrio fluvialis]MBY7954337.1 UDP-N-acetylglucosamine 2-epimerase (hydrolyzing) [Vibrio fluvialis]MBY8065453.1 UDP-N-acetylglucosamine 2-epimerase (hydrolyzing) [Vibrio fluvialis]MBY8134225.1 UDP-N-acetylglucosamine 2-epimerase (hydrolyzing) [Vibrio fluvialis]